MIYEISRDIGSDMYHPSLTRFVVVFRSRHPRPSEGTAAAAHDQ